MEFGVGENVMWGRNKRKLVAIVGLGVCRLGHLKYLDGFILMFTAGYKQFKVALAFIMCITYLPSLD